MSGRSVPDTNIRLIWVAVSEVDSLMNSRLMPVCSSIHRVSWLVSMSSTRVSTGMAMVRVSGSSTMGIVPLGVTSAMAVQDSSIMSIRKSARVLFMVCSSFFVIHTAPGRTNQFRMAETICSEPRRQCARCSSSVQPWSTISMVTMPSKPTPRSALPASATGRMPQPT